MAKKTANNSTFSTAALAFLLVAVGLPLFKTFQASDPVDYILPNFLLFTNQRDWTKQLWNKVLRWDNNIVYQPSHIPEIDAADYTYESLKRATQNFRYPAVVRGLFNGTKAQTLWPTADYFPSRIGKYNIPVVNNAIVGVPQNNRTVRPFGDAFREVVSDPENRNYLFFPVQSRFQYNHSDIGSLKELAKEVNQILLDDLDLNRIWPGFGTAAHKTYYGAQLIIGQGSESSDATTGTGWHCAIGSNWFAQVVGMKRWYFADPKYSAYMHPLRGGKVNMMTGSTEMAEKQKHFPTRYADIRAGDLLYNPDWEWHTIKNYAGFTIGCPIRELNYTLSIQNNMQYTGIVMLNKLLEKVGLDIGGYPPAN